MSRIETSVAKIQSQSNFYDSIDVGDYHDDKLNQQALIMYILFSNTSNL